MMIKDSFLVFLFLLMSVVSCSKQNEMNDSTALHGSKDEIYYTCSMHPQVHEHEPGQCPICGMPLIKSTPLHNSGREKKHLLPSDYQKDVLNFKQTKVTEKKIIFKLKVAGRIMNREQVAFYVYEVDRPFIKVGQAFEGRGASGKDLISGEITSVDHIADPSSRAIRVLGHVTNGKQLGVTEGSFFGTIVSLPEKVLMVPYDAVLRTGNKNIVYVIMKNGEITPREVKLGRSQGDQIEILHGLEEGTSIVSGPNFLLDSEARLRGLDD